MQGTLNLMEDLIKNYYDPKPYDPKPYKNLLNTITLNLRSYTCGMAKKNYIEGIVRKEIYVKETVKKKSM